MKRALHSSTCACISIETALHSMRRALHSMKRALHSMKRALHSMKRAMYAMERALHSMKRALHSSICVFCIETALHSIPKNCLLDHMGWLRLVGPLKL